MRYCCARFSPLLEHFEHDPQQWNVTDAARIYAYGPLEKFKKHLRLRGMAEMPEVRFPQPHTHHYNVEFDNDESALVDYLEWKVFPLQDNDE